MAIGHVDTNLRMMQYTTLGDRNCLIIITLLSESVLKKQKSKSSGRRGTTFLIRVSLANLYVEVASRLQFKLE